MVPASPRPPAALRLYAWSDFILASAARELRSRYARSLLGWVWLVLPPLVLIAIYALVFSQLMRGAGALPDRGPFTYSIYLCAGLITWQWFSELLSRVAGLFTNHATLLKKTIVPWYALLAVDVLVTSFGLVVQSLLFALVLVAVDLWPGSRVLAFVPLVLCQALLAVGLGLGIAVLQVFFRDVALALPLVLQLWFWLTPIVYPLAAVPEAFQSFVQWNPLQPIAAGYQHIVLAPDIAASWPRIGIVGAFAVLLVLLSLRLLRRNQGPIRDEL
ncbi:ABC transporter permease [Ramlibacter sp. PS4R-6]|uniref:ABC transporter permease n=1 Tax=Ramlibacter sp. PS4R-6 TaxID=3133438 RepID=UPI0030B6447A